MADMMWLALGVLIGAVVARRRDTREQARVIASNLSAQFAAHCERHAKRLEGSTVMTAPGAFVPLPDGRTLPIDLTSER